MPFYKLYFYLGLQTSPLPPDCVSESSWLSPFEFEFVFVFCLFPFELFPEFSSKELSSKGSSCLSEATIMPCTAAADARTAITPAPSQPFAIGGKATCHLIINQL